MPEEKPLIIDPILTQLSQMNEKLDAYWNETRTEIKELRRVQQSILEDVAELKGGFAQMDKRQGDMVSRLENVESLQRWALGVMITSWLTLVGLTVTILTKLL